MSRFGKWIDLALCCTDLPLSMSFSLLQYSTLLYNVIHYDPRPHWLPILNLRGLESSVLEIQSCHRTLNSKIADPLVDYVMPSRK